MNPCTCQRRAVGWLAAWVVVFGAIAVRETYAAAAFELNFPDNSFVELAGRTVEGNDGVLRTTGRSVIKFNGVTVHEPVRIEFHPTNRWLARFPGCILNQRSL